MVPGFIEQMNLIMVVVFRLGLVLHCTPLLYWMDRVPFAATGVLGWPMLLPTNCSLFAMRVERQAAEVLSHPGLLVPLTKPRHTFRVKISELPLHAAVSE